MSLVLARHLFIVMWVRIILILFIQRRISLNLKEPLLFTLFHSAHLWRHFPKNTFLIPHPTWSLLITQTCVRTEERERERGRPWARDSTFTKVSLCLHHRPAPALTLTHAAREKFGGNTSHITPCHSPVSSRSQFKEISESLASRSANVHWDACYIW